MKTIDLRQVFTAEQLKLAKKLKTKEQIKEQVIVPNMERINRITGQENDPDYWAYMLEHFYHRI